MNRTIDNETVTFSPFEMGTKAYSKRCSKCEGLEQENAILKYWLKTNNICVPTLDQMENLEQKLKGGGDGKTGKNKKPLDILFN